MFFILPTRRRPPPFLSPLFGGPAPGPTRRAPGADGPAVGASVGVLIGPTVGPVLEVGSEDSEGAALKLGAVLGSADSEGLALGPCENDGLLDSDGAEDLLGLSLGARDSLGLSLE